MNKSKYTISDIKEMISEDDPIIRTEIAIPIDTLIEDITCYNDLYDYFNDAICDSYLPKVACSYEFLRTEYVGQLLLIYEVEIELDYEKVIEKESVVYMMKRIEKRMKELLIRRDNLMILEGFKDRTDYIENYERASETLRSIDQELWRLSDILEAEEE